MKWAKCFLLLLSIGIAILHAQNLSSFKKVEGLNSNMVYCVMQDSKGYVWVGTDMGASRFNSHGFTSFSKANGLANDEIYQLYEDRSGRIWMLGAGGSLSFFLNGKLHHPGNEPMLAKIGGIGLGIHFSEDEDGSLWYCSLRTMYHIKWPNSIDSFGIKQVEQLCNKFVGSIGINGGRYLFMDMGWKLAGSSQFFPYPNGIFFNANNAKLQVINGHAYISQSNMLSILNLQNNTIQTRQTPNGSPILNLLPGNSPSLLLLLTANKSYHYHIGSGLFEPVQKYPVTWGTWVLHDQEQNVWMSSLQHGLYLNRKEKGFAFEHYPYMDDGNSVACNRLLQLNNKLYAGFQNGHFALFNKKGWLPQMKDVHSEALQRITCLSAVHDSIWVAGDGFFALHIPALGKNIPFKGAVKAIAFSGQYMYISSSIGISKVRRGKDAINTFYRDFYDHTRFTSLPAKTMLAVGDSLWAGGEFGTRLFINEKEDTAFTKQNTITNTAVKKIIALRKGGFAFCTKDKGLLILHQGQLLPITVVQGLPSGSCNNAWEDKEGCLWIATMSGLAKVTVNLSGKGYVLQQVENIYNHRGIAPLATYDVMVAGDTIWAATATGLTVLYSNPSTAKTVAPIFLERVDADTASIDFNSIHEFPHLKNRLSFHFASLRFSRNGKQLYRYRINGLEENWNTTQEPLANYLSIPTGSYEFVAEATDEFGNWNGQTISYRFSILPPFWKRTWFVVLCILLVVLVAGYIVFQKIRQIKSTAQMERQKLVAAKEKAEYERELAELQQKALRLQMNPHFIFNAIYAIQGFYAAGKEVDARQYISRFSSLMRQILESGNAASTTLANEINMLENYFELMKVRMNNPFEYNIDTIGISSTQALNIPSMLVQPFAENAVLHGVSPLETGGKIEVCFAVDKGFLVCTVSDNGIGRKASSQLKSIGQHVSSGISITEKRLHLFSHSNNRQHTFSLNIEDLVDSKGKATGTKVTLHIPYTETT